MSESKELLNKRLRLILFAVIAVAAAVLIALNIGVFGNVLLVLLGFGVVVLVHEFGHFIVAKLGGIKVEAFSIGFPPTLAGIRRTENGWNIRILPTLLKKGDDESDEDSIRFTVGKEGKESDTEYRVGLIPVGGFVKMLGQEDMGPVKSTDDPRSFANKSLGIRAGVLAAGVGCNVISAVIIFMIVFLIGINLPPAVVGGVVPDSPAARAGIKAGDEIIEIDGENGDLDFSNISLAAALSGKDEKVALKVRHNDGSEEDIELVAEQLPGDSLRSFGIYTPRSLTLGKFADKEDNELLYSKTGLFGGDRVKSINGIEVKSYWELEKIVRNTHEPSAKLSVERGIKAENSELVTSEIALEWKFAESYLVDSESELYHIYSMVPRMRITSVSTESVADGISLQVDDVILAVGDVENPVYTQMREVIEEFEDKELPIRVLRADADGSEKILTVTAVPKKRSGTDRVEIGVGLALDAKHPVVAKTIGTEGGPPRLDIPDGATITTVDGAPVSSFYDVMREINKYKGQVISMEYRLDEEVAGNVILNVNGSGGSITVKSGYADFNASLLFEQMERLYKAEGPAEAIAMGYKKTVMFIAQTYVTLKRLVGGLVSPKNLMGPVGIITSSYKIVAEQPFTYYVYFIGLISATIAVFNFLPLPPLDGGLVVLLLIEKIKGSALSERVQGAIAYTGWALILALFAYVTFNDILRTFFGYRL